MVFNFTEKSMILKTNAVRCIGDTNMYIRSCTSPLWLDWVLKWPATLKNRYTYVPVASF
jgi:hypothetical protein